MKKVLISLVAMVLVLTGLVSATTTTLVPSDITMDVTDAKTTEFCIYSDAGMTLPLNVAVSVGTVCRDIDGLVGCSGADIASPAGFSVTPVDATTGADGCDDISLVTSRASTGLYYYTINGVVAGTTIGSETGSVLVPEFTTIGSALVLLGAGLFIYKKKRQ